MHLHASLTNENESGFTLIEIITSIALLAMVIAVMLPIFPQMMNWSSQSEEKLTAGNLLGRVVEDVEDQKGILSDKNVGACPTLTPVQTEAVGPYQLDNHTYNVELDLCKENDVNLLRTKIRVFTPEGKRHSETYTYIKAGAGNEASEE